MLYLYSENRLYLLILSSGEEIPQNTCQDSCCACCALAASPRKNEILCAAPRHLHNLIKMNRYIQYLILVLLVFHVHLQGVRGSSTHGASCAHSDGDDDHAEDMNDSYNLNLSIISVFVLWAVSFAGAAFPLLLAFEHPWLILGIKYGAYAGSGVMLSTAFVHVFIQQI